MHNLNIWIANSRHLGLFLTPPDAFQASFVLTCPTVFFRLRRPTLLLSCGLTPAPSLSSLSSMSLLVRLFMVLGHTSSSFPVSSANLRSIRAETRPQEAGNVGAGMLSFGAVWSCSQLRVEIDGTQRPDNFIQTRVDSAKVNIFSWHFPQTQEYGVWLILWKKNLKKYKNKTSGLKKPRDQRFLHQL